MLTIETSPEDHAKICDTKILYLILLQELGQRHLHLLLKHHLSVDSELERVALTAALENHFTLHWICHLSSPVFLSCQSVDLRIRNSERPVPDHSGPEITTVADEEPS